MKNSNKAFYETQTANHLQEIIQPSLNPHLSDKTLQRIWKKMFLWRYTEIYRHFLSKYFKKTILGALRNGTMQMYSLTPSRNMSAGKFLNSERFLAVLREHIIFNIK